MTPEEYGYLAAEKWANLRTDFAVSKSGRKLVKANRLVDQFKGYDFYAYCDWSGFLFIEAKGERRHTGNFPFEHWSNFNILRPGWIKTSVAHYIVIAYQDKGIAYAMSMIDAQRIFRERHHTWREMIPHLAQPNLTKFYLAPIREVMQTIWVEVIDVERGCFINP